MSASQCSMVELLLDALDFPDRLSWLALLDRLPALGTLKCVEVALAPAGGGRLSFVVHDAMAAPLRAELAALVGESSILRCAPRLA